MMVNLPCLMVSCTNFLRPTCSYTECPLSFLTGSCPTEETTASYSSCLYFDFTDPPIPQGTDIPWTHHPVSFRWSSWWCRTTGTTSLSGFFPEPCPVSELSGTPQGSGIIHSVDGLIALSEEGAQVDLLRIAVAAYRTGLCRFEHGNIAGSA